MRSPSPSEAAPKSGPSGTHHGIHQLARVRRVGVRMMPAEVLERLAVDDRAGGRAERPLQNRPRIRPGDRRHGVVTGAKTALEERRDPLEVEQPGHQLLVVGHRIDDLDRGVAQPQLAQTMQVEIFDLQDPVLTDLLGAAIDRLGDLLGRRPAVADVVLDPEIFVRAAGIVAGRQDQPAECLALANQAGRSRGGQQPVLADHDSPEPIRRGHLQDDLHRGPVVVAAVAADHQGLALEALEHVEHRLDEVLEIVRLPENLDLLAQARGAGALVLEGGGGDGADGHDQISSKCAVELEGGLGDGIPAEVLEHPLAALLAHLRAQLGVPAQAVDRRRQRGRERRRIGRLEGTGA